MGRHFNPLLTNYFCVLLVFTLTNPSGVNFNELSNLNFNLLRRKLQTDYPPLLNGNCVDDLTGNLEGIDFGPDLTVSCSDLVFWITEIGRLSGYDKFDCSISLSEINVQGTPLDMFGDISLQFLCPESCNHCEDPLSISDLPSNSTTPFYAELLFTSETCEYDSLSPGVHINPTFETSACMKHTFGDNAIASCGPGAEFDPLGPGRCSLGDGTPAPLMHMGGDIQTPEGWIPMDDIREDGTSNTCESLCLGYQPVCRAYMTKEQTHCAITDGLPTKTDGDNSYFCFRKGGFSRVLVQTFEEETCETETAISTYDSPLSCAPLEDGVYAQAIFDWETCAATTTAPETTTTPATTATIELTDFGVYPGYSGTGYSGEVTLRFFGTSVEMTWDNLSGDAECIASGPSDAGNSCGIHIHAGDSCIDGSLVGGHYYDDTALTSDPWANAAYTTTTDSTGLTVEYGYDWDATEGRAFVLHDRTGARVTCVLIGKTEDVVTITPMGTYPGSGLTTPTGTVTLGFVDTKVSIAYELSDVDGACTSAGSSANSCGIHIHSGDSCATNEDVGGHYYAPTSDPDPWTNAVFVVTSGTDATGTLQVEFGQTYTNSMGKAFVVHDSNGVRASCNRIGAVCGDNVCDDNIGELDSCRVDCPTEEPTHHPTTEEPSRSPTASKPTLSPITEEPSRSPTASKPTLSPITPEPTPTPEDTCAMGYTQTVDLEDCLTADSSWADFDGPNLSWLVTSVQGRGRVSHFSLCIINNGNGVYEWGAIDGGVAYRTCVQASEDETTSCEADLTCNTDSVVGNPNAQSWPLSRITRANYQHQDCPTIQSTCAKPVNWWYDQLDTKSDQTREWLFDNVCVGQDNHVRVVTKTGVANTCVGYNYPNDPNVLCPVDRSFICGTGVYDQNPVYGWPSRQFELVAAAIDNPGHVHPHCPSAFQSQQCNCGMV